MGLHHLLSGSYTHTNLYLLAFDTIAKTLTLNSTIPAFGLHQYISTNAARDRIYATAMSEPPQLFSWSRTEDNKINHISAANISTPPFLPCPGNVDWLCLLTPEATSSCYVSDNGHFTFSAGGSGARINAIDEDGGVGDAVYEMFYVPEQEVPNVDKTRKAVVSTYPARPYA